MRILIDYRPALRQRTGVGGYVHETALALAATAPPAEQRVLFSSSWKDRLPPGVMPATPVVDRRVPVRALNWSWHRLGWPPVEWLAGGGFDVVHALHPLLIPSRDAAGIVTIHDLDFLDHPARTTAEIRRDYPRYVRAHAARADRVVVNSRHTAAAVHLRLGVPLDRISTCPPGAPDWARRPFEPERDACILFLGTLEPRKNLGTLVDAYGRLLARARDVPPLVLAGRIPASAEALVARLREPPFAGRVELPGYVGDDEKQTLFRRALLFVMPSHTEGFGMPVLEAMTVGVPVIAADSGALPETVGPAGILVAPGEPTEWADTLESLLLSASRRHALREAGWTRVLEYTWTQTAMRMREAWHLAITEHRRRTHG